MVKKALEDPSWVLDHLDSGTQWEEGKGCFCFLGAALSAQETNCEKAEENSCVSPMGDYWPWAGRNGFGVVTGGASKCTLMSPSLCRLEKHV